jgi:hypothetical protein
VALFRYFSTSSVVDSEGEKDGYVPITVIYNLNKESSTNQVE